MLRLHFLIASHLLEAVGWDMFYKKDEIWVAEHIDVSASDAGKKLKDRRKYQIGTRSEHGDFYLYSHVDLDVAKLAQLALPSQLSHDLRRVAQETEEKSFQDSIVSLALQIAKRQRGEDHLQPLETLIEKYMHEAEELDEAENKWDEIPDILYYATCAAAQGSLRLVRALPQLLEEYDVTMGQAKAACLAKYRLRAAGNPKNIEAEREAIMQAIGV